MKKRLLALLLVFTLLLGSTAISASAAGGTDPISIGAKTDKTITIAKTDDPIKPPDPTDGKLSIKTTKYSIDRDYDQECIVTITNNTDQPVQYYLEVDNGYNDLFANTVKSGSQIKPIVIQPGETQQVMLSVFAQNATKGNYNLPVKAYIVRTDGSVFSDATATAQIACELPDVDFTFTNTATDRATLTKTYTIMNLGKPLSDVTVSFTGEVKDYVRTNPLISNLSMPTNGTAEFQAIPDLTKMKENNKSVVSGKLVVKSGAKSQSFDVSFDTEGRPIISMTVAELVQLQSSLLGQSVSTQAISSTSGALCTTTSGYQCTNAGKITDTVTPPRRIEDGRAPSPNPSIQGAGDDVRLFITSRMYGGNDVFSWYERNEGRTGAIYVDVANTTYTYKINGSVVGTSQNAGVTDVAITELPTDKINFGAANTIVRDYDTNPGHYFVNTDNEYTFIYPGDTLISYIGTPDTLPDMRLKPDFAVYPENIFIDDANLVKGTSTTVRMNVYNRGSLGGQVDILVQDGGATVYSEQNVSIDEFSTKTFSFAWTPQNDSSDIKVTLTDKSAVPESKTDNNTATRPIVASPTYRVPTIASLDPASLLLQDGTLISASVGNFGDVTKAEFYVDSALCSGIVKNAEMTGQKRYWIEAPSTLTDGSHELKVVVTYKTGAATTDTIEKIITATVSSKKSVGITVDTAFTNPRFYVRNIDGNASPDVMATNAVSATEYQLSVTQDMLNNPGNYMLLVVADNAVLWTKLDEANITFTPVTCKTLTWQTPAGMTLEGVDLRKFSDYTAYSALSTATTLYVTPAAYRFDVAYRYNGIWGSAAVDVDLSVANQTVNLENQVKSYQFTLPASVSYASAELYYKSGSNWRSAYLNDSYNSATNTLSALLTSPGTLTGVSEAFIVVETNDTLWITAESVAAAGPVVLDTVGLRKVTINMEDPATMDFNSVMVSNGAISAYLYNNEIYMPAGNYQIIVSCLLDNKNYMQQTFDVDLTTADKTVTVTRGSGTNLSITWGNAYADTADTYGYGTKASQFAVADYEKGAPIIVTPDTYSVLTELAHGDSSYRVISYDVVVGTEAKTLTVGDNFMGTLGGFDDKMTYPGATTITLDIDDLKDENGNLLYDFSSNTETDSLKGYVLFTNVNDPTDRYVVPVTISSYDGSITVELPNATGTFNVSFRASTDGVDPEDPQDPRDPCGKIWKKVLKIVAWVLGIFGVAATATIVIKAATWFYGIILALIGIPIIGVILWLIF